MPQLSPPSLRLDPAPETIAFRAVEEVLKGDPVLKTLGLHWATWTGSAVDGVDPTPATCPYLGLSPRPGGSSWETEDMHDSPMVIVVTLAVVGTNVDELTNLWHAFRRAIFPTDPERWEVVRDVMKNRARIVKPILTLGGYARSEDKATRSNVLVAKGFLELKLHVLT